MRRFSATSACRAASRGSPSTSPPAMPGSASKLALHCEQLVRQRTRLKNQIRAVEREYGVNPYTGRNSTGVRPRDPHGSGSPRSALPTQRSASNAPRSGWYPGKGRPNPSAPSTIPGIGPINSFALRWKIEIIERFEDSAHPHRTSVLASVSARAGECGGKGRSQRPDPHSLESSSSRGRRRCARNDRRISPSTSRHFRGKGDARDRKHVNKLVVAFARKNLTFIYRCWKHGEAFNLATYQQKRAQERRQSRTHVWFAIAPPSLLLHHACPSASFQKTWLTSSSNLPNKGATKCEAAAIPMMDRTHVRAHGGTVPPFGGDRWKFITRFIQQRTTVCSIRHALFHSFSHSYSVNPLCSLPGATIMEIRTDFDADWRSG